MKPLATTHRYLTWLCLCTPDESSSKWHKRFYAAFTTAVSITLLCHITANTTYCLLTLSTNLESCLFVFLCFAGEFGVTYTLLIAVVQMRHKIDEILLELQTIYNKHENTDVFHYLADANTTSEWMWTIYYGYMAGVIMNMISLCAISVCYCWFNHIGVDNDGHLDTANFYHPLDTDTWPWDQTTMRGYVAEITSIVLLMLSYMIANGTILLFYVSLCLHHRAFYQMVKHAIGKSNQQTDGAVDGNRCDGIFLRDLIQFHMMIKGWFLDTAQVYSPFVMVLLICNTIMMAITVFYLDMQINHIDFRLAMALTAATINVSALFIYCNFGKIATESYEKICDCVFNLKWYRLSIRQQKYFVLMIQNMHKPLYYHGFGITYLNLDTFSTFVKAAFNYFMVLKTFTAK